MDKAFQKRIISLYSEDGLKWLNSLPILIDKYKKKWKIKTQPPYNLSYNYVCPAITNSCIKAVLKLSVPKSKEFITEVEALKQLPKEAAVQIIHSDLLSGAVLLERAEPGYSLRKINPNEVQIHCAS